MKISGGALALAVAAVMANVALSACAGGPADDRAGSTSGSQPASLSHGGPVRDHVSFVDRLRADGLRVDVLSSVRRHGLRPEGTRLRLVGGGLLGSAVVESYNYDSSDLGTDAGRVLGQDAERIVSDGGALRTKPDAASPRHWFRAERLLVGYAGSNLKVITLLTRVLGPPFAGPGAGS